MLLGCLVSLRFSCQLSDFIQISVFYSKQTLFPKSEEERLLE
jgi:hypothetical protein